MRQTINTKNNAWHDKPAFPIHYILWFVLCMALLGFPAFNIYNNGDHLTMHVESPGLVEPYIDDNAGNMSIEKVKYENKEMMITLEAQKPGTGFMEIPAEGSNPAQFFEFRTVPFLNKTILIRDNGYFTGIISADAALMLIFLSGAFTFYYSFREKRRAAKYSYSMVKDGGLCLFFLAQGIILFAALMVNYYGADINIPDYIIGMGRKFVLLMAPLMLVGALHITYSNLTLIKREGFRLSNILGILFSLVWLVSSALLFYIYRRSGGSALLKSISVILEITISYMECLFLSTVLCAWDAQNYVPVEDKDYIIILGCGLMPDGTLTSLLKGRVNRALDFEKKQFEHTGKHAVFVPSGAQGNDEICSEAAAISQYLQNNGVDPGLIRLEEQAVNTKENIRFSKDLILSEDPDARVGFSTTNYHVFRTYTYSKDLDFYAQGMSADTKSYFFTNAFVREFAGLLWKHWFQHLFFLSFMILFYLILTAL